MAIYSASLKTVSRSSGRSATAAWAYRAAEEVADERTGETFDFTRKGGVMETGMVGWRGTGAELWNAAEKSETRKNSTVARELLIALPAELTPQQSSAAARRVAADLHERYGVAVAWAMHEPSRDGDDRNRHVHMMFTTRTVDAATGKFGAKTRILDDQKTGKKEVEWMRERWETIANEALQAAGVDARIDRRSLKDQGIYRPAQQHEGPQVTRARRQAGRGHRIDELAERMDVVRHNEATKTHEPLRRLAAAELAGIEREIAAELEAIGRRAAAEREAQLRAEREAAAAAAKREAAAAEKLPGIVGRQVKFETWALTADGVEIARAEPIFGGRAVRYNMADGSTVTNTGERVTVQAQDGQRASDLAIAAMTALAKKNGWQSVTITGDREFQERAARAMARARIRVENPDLQKAWHDEMTRQTKARVSERQSAPAAASPAAAPAQAPAPAQSRPVKADQAKAERKTTIDQARAMAKPAWLDQRRKEIDAWCAAENQKPGNVEIVRKRDELRRLKVELQDKSDRAHAVLRRGDPDVIAERMVTEMADLQTGGAFSRRVREQRELVTQIKAMEAGSISKGIFGGKLRAARKEMTAAGDEIKEMWATASASAKQSVMQMRQQHAEASSSIHPTLAQIHQIKQQINALVTPAEQQAAQMRLDAQAESAAAGRQVRAHDAAQRIKHTLTDRQTYGDGATDLPTPRPRGMRM